MTAGIQATSGKDYLYAIMDCSSKRIVGYSIDSRMHSIVGPEKHLDGEHQQKRSTNTYC
jgi:transposase InsO family protein